MHESVRQQFTAVTKSLQGQITIFVSQVDPDAIAAAVGLDCLLRHIRKENHIPSQIVYGGFIGHPQNRAIINRFNLTKFLVPAYEAVISPHASTALVDSSVIDDVRLPKIAQFPPKITIDHHRGSTIASTDKDFVLVQDVGAASTLVFELLESNDVILNNEDEQVVRILLALGIYTDTKSLLGAGPRDLEAYQKLCQKLRPEELAQLINYKVGSRYFSYLRQALDRRQQQGSRLVAGVGFMEAEDGDQLAALADDFLRQDGVSLVVVWGIIGNKVRISARCCELGIPLDDFLKKHFSAKAGAKLTPDGRGEGGALLEIDLGFWRIPCTELHILAMVEAWMTHTMFIV